MKRNFIIFAISAILSLSTSAFSQQSKQDVCIGWQGRIDDTLSSTYLPIYVEPKDFSEQEIFTAIECLLKLEGNKNKARFSGAMRTDISSVPQFTAVEVSALWYNSYLYYQKFDHGGLIVLMDSSGEFNSPNAVKKAYKSYRKWLIKVKKIGLTKAREQKLDPLAYTKVKWW